MMKMTRTVQSYTLYLMAFMGLLLLSGCSDSNDNNSNDDTPIPMPTEGFISEYDLNKNIIQVNVNNMATGLRASFETMTDNDERAALAQALVINTRFFDDDSGYFFIETLLDATVIAHIYQDWIGTSRFDAQDLNGKYHVQEMINTVNYIGHGFVQYYFTNPATEAPADKLSFVTGINSADWFIGAGLYNEGIDNPIEINQANKDLVKEVTTTLSQALANTYATLYPDESSQTDFSRTFIDHMRFFDDQSGYFFIIDYTGKVIAHGSDPSLEGEDLWDLQDQQGTYIVQGLIDTAQSHSDGGYFEYYWTNPATGDDEEKVSFVINIPGTDYLIGSGVYLH